MSSNRRDTDLRSGSARGGPGIPSLKGREDVNVPDRSNCAGRRHGTVRAYRYHQCRCEDAIEARVRQRRIDRDRAAERAATPPSRIAPLTWTTGAPPPADAEVDWRLRAGCRGLDPEWWTTPAVRPEGVPVEVAEAVARGALRVCASCPVRLDCAGDPAEPDPVGVIRGGKVYNRVGQVAGDCVACGRVVLCRPAGSRHCSDVCAGRYRPRRAAGRGDTIDVGIGGDVLAARGDIDPVSMTG